MKKKSKETDTGMNPMGGMNRTGIAMSPKDSKLMLENSEIEPTSSGDEDTMADQVSDYFAAKDVVGSMPPPASFKGAVATAAKALTGRKANVLIDKLGERLAYERTGVRLYTHFLHKCEVQGSDMPSAADIEEIRNEELEHMHLVSRAMEAIGADPTAITPGADVQGVAGMGYLQAIGDPRTTIDQCLEVLMAVELNDNASWEMLIPLAKELGQDEMADEFQTALQHENEHLARVKQWLNDRTFSAAGVA